MDKRKRIFFILPEYFLIATVVFYWVSSGIKFNPIAFGLILILILQIIFRSRIVGIIIPGLLITVGFFMLLALISELNEFTTFNSDAKSLLFVGIPFIIFTIIVSGIMIFKYTAIETAR